MYLQILIISPQNLPEFNENEFCYLDKKYILGSY